MSGRSPAIRCAPQARALIEHWSGRAAADDVGYRIVRATRSQVRKDVFESLTATGAPALSANVKFTPSAQFEGPLWQLVTQRPAHLLDPHYQSWEAALLGSLDRALADAGEGVQGTCSAARGAQDEHAAHEASAVALRCRSPVAGSTCRRSRCRAMQHMPRVQGEAFGASQRLVVSPGREAQGSLQMPGGPVDHPLSPFYGAGHDAWVRGEPTPLLPGGKRSTRSRLRPTATLSSANQRRILSGVSMSARFQRHRQLRRHRRSDDGGQRRRDAGAAAAGQGRARHRQDAARGRSRAARCSRPLYRWHIKSTTKAQQGLYEYDAVSRLRDSQLGEEKVHDIGNYIIKGRLWEAFESEVQPVLLVDEIDKADIEFPNDLLHELDRMEFYVYETRQWIKARHRPIIVITSNNEKELPDAFLRRCFFHYIRFPDTATMERIVDVHYPNLKKELLAEALTTFFKVREMPGLKKKPSTSELLDWIKLLLAEDIPPEVLRDRRSEEGDPAAVRRAAQERAGRAPVRAAGVPASSPAGALSAGRARAHPVLLQAARGRRAGLDHRVPDAARGARSASRAIAAPRISTSCRAPAWSRTSGTSIASTARSRRTSRASKSCSRRWSRAFRKSGCSAWRRRRCRRRRRRRSRRSAAGTS